jgi:hypothetical protein
VIIRSVARQKFTVARRRPTGALEFQDILDTALQLFLKYRHAPWGVRILHASEVTKIKRDALHVLNNDDHRNPYSVGYSQFIKYVRIAPRTIGNNDTGSVYA